MGMNNSAHAYQQIEQEQSYQQSQIRVLDGSKAKAREDARRGRTVKMVISVSTGLFCLLAMTFMSAKICGLGVEINSIQSEIAETKTMTARAELELGQLGSLQRIEAYAINNLGMVYPSASDIYFLDAESSQILAEGKAAQDAAAAAAAEPVVGEEPSGFDGVISSIVGFFRGTASAAEN